MGCKLQFTKVLAFEPRRPNLNILQCQTSHVSPAFLSNGSYAAFWPPPPPPTPSSSRKPEPNKSGAERAGRIISSCWPGVFRVHAGRLAGLCEAQAFGCLDLHPPTSHRGAQKCVGKGGQRCLPFGFRVGLGLLGFVGCMSCMGSV